MTYIMVFRGPNYGRECEEYTSKVLTGDLWPLLRADDDEGELDQSRRVTGRLAARKAVLEEELANTQEKLDDTQVKIDQEKQRQEALGGSE